MKINYRPFPEIKNWSTTLGNGMCIVKVPLTPAQTGPEFKPTPYVVEGVVASTIYLRDPETNKRVKILESDLGNYELAMSWHGVKVDPQHINNALRLD